MQPQVFKSDNAKKWVNIQRFQNNSPPPRSKFYKRYRNKTIKLFNGGLTIVGGTPPLEKQCYFAAEQVGRSKNQVFLTIEWGFI